MLYLKKDLGGVIMYTWNLDSLYKGFDEKFYSDVEELEKSIEVFIVKAACTQLSPQLFDRIHFG